MAKKGKGGELGGWITRSPQGNADFNLNQVIPTDVEKDYNYASGKGSQYKDAHEGIYVVGGTPTGPFDSHREDGLTSATDMERENSDWGDGPTGSDSVSVGTVDL